MKKLFPALLASIFFVACGDDSSSNPAPESNPDSSSSSEQITEPDSPNQESPETPTETPSSSSVTDISIEFTTEAVSSASAYSCSTTPLVYGSGVDVTCDSVYLGSIMADSDETPYDPNQTYYDFVGIEKVFNSIQPGDKIAIVIRHAARTKSTDQSGILTGLGELQSIDLGKRLSSIGEPYYYHSEILRTEQTCHKIAQGRGQTEIKHVTLSELNGGWFVKDEEAYAILEEEAITVYDLISDYAYNGKYLEAHYELAPRAEQLINDVILGKMIASNPVSIAVSHDQLVVPLLVHATNAQIDLRYYESLNWLNFLAGLAVIVRADGSVQYVPIKGLDRGTL